MAIDRDSALEALKKVKDPELGRDLVSLGMVKDLAVTGGAVKVTEPQLQSPDDIYGKK